MASPFTVFRKYQAAMLAVFGVLIIVVFVIGDPLSRIIGGGGGARQDPVVVQWEGAELTQSRLYSLLEMRAVVHRLLVRGQTLAIQQGAFGEDAINRLRFGLPLPEQPIISQGSLTPGDTVRTLVMAEKARKDGYVVPDTEITDYLMSLVDRKLSSEQLRDLIEGRELDENGQKGPRRYAVSAVYDVLREEMLANKLFEQFYRGSLGMPMAQQLDYYSRLNRRIEAEVLTIPVANFLDEVRDPTESEIEEYFAAHKSEVQPLERVGGTTMESPRPGFKLPQRVAVEYVTANPDDWVDGLRDEITDEDIQAYYEENKDADEQLHADEDLVLPNLDDDETSEDETSDEETSDEETSEPAEAGASRDSEPAGSDDATEPADGSDEEATDSSAAEPSDEAGSSTGEAEPSDDPPADDGDASDGGTDDPPATPSDPPGPDDSRDDAVEKGAVEKGAVEKGAVEKGAGNEEAPGEVQQLAGDEGAENEAPLVEAEDADDDGAAAGVADDDQPAAAASNGEGAATDSSADGDSEGPATAGSEPGDGDTGAADTGAADTGAADTGDGDTGDGEPKDRKVSYKPLDEVRDYIHQKLARQKANERVEEKLGVVRSSMENYYKARIYAEEGEEPALPRPDLKASAQRDGLKWNSHDLLSARAFQDDTAIGKSSKNVPGTQQNPFPPPVPFAAIAFREGEHSLFKPDETLDDEGNRYLFWKTEERGAEVPELDDVRDEVVRSWKLGAGLDDVTDKARGLARRRAEELAVMAQDGKALSEISTQQAGSNLTETESFSWLTTGSAAAFNPWQPQQPRLSPIAGVNQPGPEFMQTAFGLGVEDVGAAMNHPQSEAYVIRVARENKSHDVVQANFLEEMQDRRVLGQIQAAAQLDWQLVQQDWLDELDSEFNVVWLKPEARFAR